MEAPETGARGLHAPDEIDYLDRFCRQIPAPNKGTAAENNKPNDLESELALRDIKQEAFVLLAEPGMGKTESLTALAAQRAGEFISASNFIIRPVEALNPEIFYCIDALDEARLNSNNAFQELRKLISQAKLKKFCISCRIADWHSTDAEALQSITPGVLAYALLPISEEQSRILLQHQGVTNPDHFLQQARTLGFADMLGNPQSLILLAEAYKSNALQFPATRRDAYELACTSQLKEDNPHHRREQKQLSNEALLDAAGWLCTLLLLSNTQTIQDPKEREADGSKALQPAAVLHQIPAQAFSKDEIAQVLESRLFSKPQAYAPIHRTIAEYLAARYLTKRVNAGLLPTRICALMLTEHMGQSYLISNLRGLAGWLASLCDPMRAAILNADPIAVLEYGDLHLLTSAAKETLINALAQRVDFYWKWTYWQRIAHFAPLVQGEMHPFVTQWLQNLEPTGVVTRSGSGSVAYLLLLVLEESTQDARWALPLERIVENNKLPAPLRQSALDGLGRHASNAAAVQLRLLHDIRSNTLYDPECSLLGTLLEQLYPEQLSPAEVLPFINWAKEDGYDGRYRRFWTQRLREKTQTKHLIPWMDAIEQAIAKGQFAPDEHSVYKHKNPELGQLALRAIQTLGANESAAKLALWLSWCCDRAVVSAPFSLSEDKDLKALAEWQREHPERLKEAIEYRLRTMPVKRCHLAEWVVVKTDVYPANMSRFWLDLTEALLQEPDTSQHIKRAQWCLIKAYRFLEAREKESGIDFEAIADLAQRYAALHETWEDITISPLEDNWEREDWLRRAQDRRQKQELETQRAKYINDHLQHLPDIESGKDIRYLNFAATHVRIDERRNHNKRKRAAPKPVGEAARSVGIGQDSSSDETDWFIAQLEHHPGLKAATQTGCVNIVKSLKRQDAIDSETARLNNKKLHIEKPAILGATLIFKKDEQAFLALSDEILSTLLHFLFLDLLDDTKDWFFSLCENKAEMVRSIWLSNAKKTMQQMKTLLRSNDLSARISSLVWPLFNRDEPRLHTMAKALLPSIFENIPIKLSKYYEFGFARILFGIIRSNPESLPDLIEARLSKKSIDAWQKAYLIMAGLCVAPDNYVERLRPLLKQPLKARQPYIECAVYLVQNGFGSPALGLCPMEAMVLVFRLFAPLCPSELPKGAWGHTYKDDGRDLLYKLSEYFLNDVTESGLSHLKSLCTDASLAQWHSVLNRQAIKYAQILSEQKYTIPSPEQVADTISNKRPSNHDDLLALARDAIKDLQSTIKNNDTNPIHRFWAVDSNGKRPQPPHRPEAECRNVIADWLRLHFEKFGVSVAVENQHGAQQQSDIALLVNSAGQAEMLLPIEVKGDWHSELWTAPIDQLAEKYSSDVRAKNRGIYLVLWTGEGTIKNKVGTICASPEELRTELERICQSIDGYSIKPLVLDISIKKR